jgi:flavodoxin
MKALVVYDSVFGNTEKIAMQIGKVFGPKKNIVRIRKVTPGLLEGINLLIVGSPTNGFCPTPGTSVFLRDLQLKHIKVAAFDTRIDKAYVKKLFVKFFMKIWGYAAEPIAKMLVNAGGELVVPPEGFYVIGNAGPLRDGELARARKWAKQILAKLAESAAKEKR